MEKTIYSEQSTLLREVLTSLREKAKLSQRALAQRIGREHSFVARVELGERRLDVVEFWWYCRACEVRPEKVATALMKDFEEAFGRKKEE